MAARRREGRRGDRDADCEQLANEAVARGFATESFVRTARVFEDTAHVQELLGRRADAARFRERAVRMHERKGNLLALARLREDAGMPTGAGT